MKPLHLWLPGLVFIGAVTVASAASAQEWITTPGLGKNAVAVLHFRREFDLSTVPSSFPIEVSADNRFILYVNGQRVGQGPARGDLAHWRYETFDLKPYLKSGHNVVAAEVWNALGDPAKPGLKGAPMAQISAQTGFWVRGQGAAANLNSDGHWRVAVQPGHTFSSPFLPLVKALKNVWYAAGGTEAIDGTQADWNWAGAKETRAKWNYAVPALDAGTPAPWTLVADPLPAMAAKPIAPGMVVRSDSPELKAFPARAVTIAPNTETKLLIDQGVMVAGYPELLVSGGKDAKVTVTYAEALYDDQAHKGDRSEVGSRKVIGISDTFQPDGGDRRAFRPLWWRTWRYMEIAVKTGAQPLTLDGLHLSEDAYPFEQKGYFRSSDPELNRIWDIGWRTLRIDAHETFMDSAYWEQLQYVGDTRIEARIAYSVSGDPRLPAQAIDAFGESARPDGMIQSAYPSNSSNIIPTFGLLWIGMLHDYWMRQPDRAVITRNLPEARKIADWYAPYVSANGLLTRNPEWNFVDWVGDPPLAREKFPSFDKDSGTSCLTSLLYLGALKQLADLEASAGDADMAKTDIAKASALTTAIQNNCWDASRGLYADDPSKKIFSQHANALAVLYDVAPKDKAESILDKVTTPTGIEAPAGILETSYYFSWYLIHAFDHAGLGDSYLDRIQTWRDLARLHYTTWPEERGNTRSDTHAWSAHPTADLLGIVAGIQPGAPGYAAVRIAPHPGQLKSFEAGAMSPKGLVRVAYKAAQRKARITITLPAGLSGRFEWQGQSRPLKAGTNRLTVKAPAEK